MKDLRHTDLEILKEGEDFFYKKCLHTTRESIQYFFEDMMLLAHFLKGQGVETLNNSLEATLILIFFSLSLMRIVIINV